MIYIYLDESGCLGFNFSKKGTFNHFTICLLAVPGEQNKKNLHVAVNRTLKNKINPRNKHKLIKTEFKGSKDPLATKTYFLNQLNRLKVDFKIYSLTADKREIPLSIRDSHARLYNYLVGLLLKKVAHLNNYSVINFIFDRCKSPKEIQNMNHYLFVQLSVALSPKITLYFDHKDSISDKGLSAVDYFCNGIFKKYESNNSDFYNQFQSNIACDMLYNAEEAKRPV